MEQHRWRLYGGAIARSVRCQVAPRQTDAGQDVIGGATGEAMQQDAPVGGQRDRERRVLIVVARASSHPPRHDPALLILLRYGDFADVLEAAEQKPDPFNRVYVCFHSSYRF